MLLRSAYHTVFPARIRMLVYTAMHPEMRLEERLSRIAREGINEFMDSVARDKLIGGKILEVGSGQCTENYKRFAVSNHYLRSDIRVWPGSTVDLLCNCQSLPFGSESLDAIICSEVLEHVTDFEPALREITRVLRVGGHLVMTVPFFYPLHGIKTNELGDCWRYTPGTLKRLLGNNYELVREHRSHMFPGDETFVVNIQMIWQRVGDRKRLTMLQ